MDSVDALVQKMTLGEAAVVESYARAAMDRRPDLKVRDFVLQVQHRWAEGATEYRVATVPGHQSASFAGNDERKTERG